MSVDSLFGWPAATAQAREGAIEVVGVPSDSGNSIASGARFGPAAIRRASLALRPDAIGIDHGDIGHVHGCDWEDVLKHVEDAVDAIIRRRSRPVVLGGDHAISYAAVAAFRDFGPLNLVWFDAHTDFCAWRDAGFHNHKQVLRRIAGLDHVGRIVQIGHRGITYFDEAGGFDRMTVVTAGAARESCVEAVLEQLPADEPVYMSIDIDAVDPLLAPGTGHPVPGGLSVARLGQLARAVASSRTVVGVDLMEVNPLLDHHDMTSAAAAAILAELVPELTHRSGAVGAGADRPAMVLHD